MSVGPGEIRFLDTAAPPVPAEDYQVQVKQQVDLDGSPDPPPPAYVFKQRVQVAGPHFGLNPGDVVSAYPPAGSQADYSQSLPHVVLARRTLPWEILLTGPQTTQAAPWLAVLLFTPEEIEGTGNPAGTAAVSLAGYLRPTDSSVLGPSFEADQVSEWLAEYPKLSCATVKVDVTAFTATAPQLGELTYLAHVRDADVEGQEDIGSPDGTFAVAIGNRLPVGSPTGVYVAHLVSLEGFELYLPGAGAPPDGIQWVQLISLFSWTFNSLTGSGDFRALMEGLDIGPFQLPPTLLPEAATPAQQVVSQAIQDGYTGARYQTRIGAETVGWYRGPLLPVQLLRNLQPFLDSSEAALIYDQSNGVFDVSYAVAWQTGRLQALANRQFSVALLGWVRENAAKAQLLAERLSLSQRHPLLTRSSGADLLARDAMRRAAVTHLSRQLAPRIAPSDPRATPLLGPRRDPSGLRAHAGRLPGIVPQHHVHALTAGRLSERLRGCALRLRAWLREHR